MIKNKNIEVTVISLGVKLVGAIETFCDILIEGEITGPITSKGKVIVAKEGVVKGNITGQSVELKGLCVGNIIAQSSVILAESAYYEGTVSCESIEIQKGAKFIGELISTKKSLSEINISEESKVLDINSLTSKTSSLMSKESSFSSHNKNEEPRALAQGYW